MSGISWSIGFRSRGSMWHWVLSSASGLVCSAIMDSVLGKSGRSTDLALVGLQVTLDVGDYLDFLALCLLLYMMLFGERQLELPSLASL